MHFRTFHTFSKHFRYFLVFLHIGLDLPSRSHIITDHRSVNDSSETHHILKIQIFLQKNKRLFYDSYSDSFFEPNQSINYFSRFSLDNFYAKLKISIETSAVAPVRFHSHRYFFIKIALQMQPKALLIGSYFEAAKRRIQLPLNGGKRAG